MRRGALVIEVIDGRSCLFRPSWWTEDQTCKPNPISTGDDTHQDAKKVWFADVHPDVGRGYECHMGNVG